MVPARYYEHAERTNCQLSYICEVERFEIGPILSAHRLFSLPKAYCAEELLYVSVFLLREMYCHYAPIVS